MAGPRRTNRRRTALTRRDFLRRAGLGSAALGVLPLLPGCGSRSETPAGGGGQPLQFLHGVASGDPLADRVMLWTRVSGLDSGRVTVNYGVYADPQLTQAVRSGSVETDAARDFTVKVDVTGLQPGTSYYYQFESSGMKSPVGRTRTLPVGSVDRLRIGVVSCASYAHGLFNAYGRLAERQDLDLVVHLGDYIYEYSSGDDGKEVYGDFRRYEPPTEILTLSDYRTRYAQYRRDPDLQALHRQHPMINVWDDHETADNSWMGGAVNHNENGDEGDWNARVGVALQAFYEWLPIRPVSADRRASYRRFALGDLADLIMTETRLLARSEQATPLVQAPPPLPSAIAVFPDAGAVAAADRQLLGPEQEQWLSQQLQSSSATWKLLGQQVMFGQLKVVGAPNALGTSLYLNPDQWDGYPRARERVYAMIDGSSGAKVDNVVVLTGDIHTSWAMDITPDPNNPLAYNPLTGSGSLAVEFVATSITSPGLEQLNAIADVIRPNNPHIKYVDLAQKGYLLLDLTPQRLVGEHWYVDSIEQAGAAEQFGIAFEVAAGSNRLVAGTQTTPKDDPPPFAP
ncbi:alkaline phosphatase D family protein [Fontimonas sp. SYSU GA230001]|uniref:alkaline phosphatase D family protein n=1 Tax=Fontimonas sp. SYSU GA230001 TaxID=3142450 RepID=UPI0032B4BE52